MAGRWLAGLALVALAALPLPARASDLVIVVGDSTARTYPFVYGIPVQGWGHPLRDLFRADVGWRNDAAGGQSTKSFIDSGRWEITMGAGPEFVLIQFGINDTSDDPAYHTDPQTSYRANLRQMISEARNIDAEPILITSSCIRYVAEDGVHVLRPSPLEAWVNAMRQQAAEDGVLLIDMHEWSLDTYDAIGFPEAQELFGFIDGNGEPDRIHFSVYGAGQAAEMVADGIRSSGSRLATLLVNPPPPPAPTVPALPPFAALALVAALGAAALRAR